MALTLKLLMYLSLCAEMTCVHQLQWLPCQFTDEMVKLNNEGHVETELIHREAMLQFGLEGDGPVNPNAITFLVTGSKVELRQYIKGVESEELVCEVRRYSTEGIHIRWPVKGTEEYSHWFTLTLKHKDLFTIIGFLRQPSDQPPSGQHDYRSWSAIEDRAVLTTTVVLVMNTQSPSVTAGLGTQQKLHCLFAIDHKVSNVTVEWYRQRRGERNQLFSFNSRSGKNQGSGVALKSVMGGDATYTLPFASVTSEGTYICSVAVTPLFTSLEISLNVKEPPRVTLNVPPTLSLQEGEERKIVCEAEGYYPLDVEMVWYQQDPEVSAKRVGAPLPTVLQNVLLSSHRHNQDKTYSLSAFFYFQASLRDSKKQFTCSVSHQSLRVPIKKSFILTVEERGSWMFYLTIGFLLVSLLVVLGVLLCFLYSTRKKSVQKKPY
ncbi:uncharacterized protein V6R79_006942 [Siganus canaliculatus]